MRFMRENGMAKVLHVWLFVGAVGRQLGQLAVSWVGLASVGLPNRPPTDACLVSTHRQPKTQLARDWWWQYYLWGGAPNTHTTVPHRPAEVFFG